MQAKTTLFPVQFRVGLRGEHSAISSQEQMVEPFALPCYSYWSMFLFYGRNTNLVPSQIPECTCSSAFTFCSHWTSLHLLTPAFTVLYMGDIFSTSDTAAKWLRMLDYFCVWVRVPSRAVCEWTLEGENEAYFSPNFKPSMDGNESYCL